MRYLILVFMLGYFASGQIALAQFTSAETGIETSAKKRKAYLLGTWKLETVNGKIVKTERYLTFKEDGTFQQSKKKAVSGDMISRNGAWKLAEDGTSLDLAFDGEKSETVKVVTLRKTTFGFKDSKNEFVLSKKD
jgi:hypothetical protein